MSVAELMKPVEILLIEDNPGDVRLTKEALKEAKAKVGIVSLADGSAALSAERCAGRITHVPSAATTRVERR